MLNLNAVFSAPIKALFFTISLATSVVPMSSISAQTTPISYTFEQLDSLQMTTPKLAVIMLHTDWCRYCKRMEKTTFQNADVKQVLDDHFYFLSFDAASKADVSYAGRTFKYLPTGRNTGVHELAQLLGQDENGQLSYPTLLLLSPEQEIIFRHNGYLNAKQLLKVLEAARMEGK